MKYTRLLLFITWLFLFIMSFIEKAMFNIEPSNFYTNMMLTALVLSLYNPKGGSSGNFYSKYKEDE